MKVDIGHANSTAVDSIRDRSAIVSVEGLLGLSEAKSGEVTGPLDGRSWSQCGSAALDVDAVAYREIAGSIDVGRQEGLPVGPFTARGLTG